MKMLEVIKKTALAAVENSKPVNVVFGTVIALSPLQIKLSQKQIYSAKYFIIRQGDANFEVGDKLILLRIQGGQQFLILGKKGEF